MNLLQLLLLLNKSNLHQNLQQLHLLLLENKPNQAQVQHQLEKQEQQVIQPHKAVLQTTKVQQNLLQQQVKTQQDLTLHQDNKIKNRQSFMLCLF
ncbi:hypothetical protein [Mycoplasma struthionis]|uniref:Uncharacterized protein n=1 Tax=Mycoplasma struthionis TaxID=538220 RepID=A0A502M4A4_9MOLU|nr:hypothetical protein [Mycoplasma struthionis]TPI02567.1 hypothetical protein FJM01_00470 [Mycoplasma struthionis]